MNRTLRSSVGASATALLASSATLVCCVLPAVLVSIGAGAAVAGLVTAVPQLIWLSEHKLVVFGGAAALLIVSGLHLRYAGRLPCPVEPHAARACMRLRAVSRWLYVGAAGAFVVGVLFAFVLPAL